MSVTDNFIYTQCGRNGDVNERCDKLKDAKERHVKFVKLGSRQTNREQVPCSCDEFIRNDRLVKKLKKESGSCFHFSKNFSPPWTRRFLIKLFDKVGS